MANQGNRKSASTKKPTAKGKAQPAKKAAQAVERNTLNTQLTALVLFIAAVFMLCLVFIKGEALWGGLRSVMFGVLGFTSYLWPILFGYIAVMLTMDRLTPQKNHKIIEAAVLIVFLSAAVHIFGFSGEVDYFSDIHQAYIKYSEFGSTFGNGAVGALLGGLILLMTGSSKPAAVAIILILLFAMLMLFTGTTLVKLFRGVAQPAKRVTDYAEERYGRYRDGDGEEDEEEAERERQTERRRAPERRRREREYPNPADDEELLSIDEANRKRKIKKQIDFNLPVENEGEISKAEEPLNNNPIQLDDIISNMNGKSRASKPEAKEEKPKQDDAEIKEQDVDLSAENEEGGEAPKKEYKLPPLDCLETPKNASSDDYEQELKQNATKLVDTLKSFGVETRVVDISRGPSVTRYEIQPAAGVKISKITNLSDDIALNLAASGVRIEAPIPNKAAVGIEIPNKHRAMVTFRELLDTDLYRKNAGKSKLSVALGKDIAGNCTYADIAKMPHLLVCGTTGSGKSVCLNTMIVSILYNAKPDEVKLLMIDPKQVEFTIYNGIPHLLVPVVSDPRKASGALAWAVGEMHQRYKMFSENNVRDINGYNSICDRLDKPKLPQIVIFIDELSDLMMAAPHEVEDSICRLAQMARAAGMHLVIATQRPSVDVITGLIKANIPSRLSLKTSSQIDSRTIIDSAGAEKLLGNGDMLFYPVGIAKPLRIQGCYLSDKEVENVVDFLKAQEKSEYDDEVIREIERQAAMDKKKNGGTAEISSDSGDSDSDEMLPKAIEVVVESQMASTTLLQRKLKLGYARAARIVDELEERGIVGPYEGSKPRKVLISTQQWLEMNAMAQGGNTPAPAIIENDNTPDEDVLSTESDEI